jgi:hypothetical protein
MNNKHIVVMMVAVLWCAAPAFVDAAQPRPAEQRLTPTTLEELVLKDGSRLYGSVERETEEEVVFRTHAGLVVTVRRTDIARLQRVDGSVVNEEFWRADPNATRLFFAPTGRSVPRGQVYLGVFEFVMPFVQVGITDRLSIGGGTPLLVGFDEDWERPFWVTPKLQVLRGDRLQVSIGTFHIFDTSGEGGGIAYAVGTYGGREASMTVGIGGTYTGFDGGGGVIMAGGDRQVSRNIKLVTENYLWKGGDGIVSAGVRFFGEKLSADLALAGPIGTGDFFLFPVVNFVYVFQRD